MNVAVAVATMPGFFATPVAASSPLGTSSARIGAPLAFAQAIQYDHGAPGARDKPTPKRPSTISAGLSDGVVATVGTPAAVSAASAFAASPTGGSARATTTTS